MAELKGYHAHVYYDASTKPIAERLRNTILAKFTVTPGAFSDEPRGPHPISQFNVIFETPEFQNIVQWLMLNRDGLDVELADDRLAQLRRSRLGVGVVVDVRVIALDFGHRKSPAVRVTIALRVRPRSFC